MRSVAATACLLLATLTLTPATAQTAKEPRFECYDDTVGSSDETALRAVVCFGLGNRSWADRLVSFTPGMPVRCGAEERAIEALGKKDRARAWLGNGGILTLAFDDNQIADTPGPDLWIFEEGARKEPVEVSLSADGKVWVHFGQTSGGRTAIDLAVNPETRGRIFSELRLTDLAQKVPSAACIPRESRDFPGADVNAVGADICSITFGPGQLALFAVNQSDLTEEARTRLRPIVELLQNTESVRVTVEGFADADGSAEHNAKLSKARAQSVKAFLEETMAGQLEPSRIAVETAGRGELGEETDSADDKAADRKVEIEILPAGENACPQRAR